MWHLCGVDERGGQGVEPLGHLVLGVPGGGDGGQGDPGHLAMLLWLPGGLRPPPLGTAPRLISAYLPLI